jgi:hypothetical protein
MFNIEKKFGVPVNDGWTLPEAIQSVKDEFIRLGCPKSRVNALLTRVLISSGIAEEMNRQAYHLMFGEDIDELPDWQDHIGKA